MPRFVPTDYLRLQMATGGRDAFCSRSGSSLPHSPSSHPSARPGAGTTLVAEAAGGRIGLVGAANPLEDGLVIIDVSAARAVAAWDSAAGGAASSATPPLAGVKVRDLLDLVPGDYLTATVPALELNILLAPLAGTVLDSSVEAAAATPAQSGPNVAASTSGVALRLLKGLGEVVQPVQAAPALPHTGGATPAFMLGAAALGTGGTALAALRRRRRGRWEVH